MDDLNQLFDQVDQALGDHRFDNDLAMAGRVSLALAEQLSDLDATSLGALDVSRRLWAGEAVEPERLNCLQILWERDNAAGPPRSTRFSINRLIIGSLINHEGFSPFHAEWIIGTARDAGLTPAQIRAVFQRYLSNL
jgi:hypothetical protein